MPRINGDLVRALQAKKPPKRFAALVELVRSRQVEGRPYEIRDDKLRGFILRVQPSGKLLYYAEWGRAKRKRIGEADGDRTAEAARAECKSIQTSPPERPSEHREAPTLRAFLSPSTGKAHTYADVVNKAELDRLLAAFDEHKDKRLDQITPWHVSKRAKAQAEAGKSVASIVRETAMLCAAMRKAHEWGQLSQNPLAGLIRRRKGRYEIGGVKLERMDRRGRVRYLGQHGADEEQRLRQQLRARDARLRRERESANRWRAERGYALLPEITGRFADHLEPAVLISMNTGLRRGELLNLRWGAVSLDRKLITVAYHTAKDEETRHLPLNREALDVLRDWKAQQEDTGSDDYVFANGGGVPFKTLKTAWAKVLKDAGIDDFRWHDLRHHFASRCVMAGVSLYVVKELLGHSSISMTEKYAHLAPDLHAAAVDRLAPPESAPREATEI